MLVEITFLAGRYHATPWGRHVNEAVPEWPPAPFRVLRALLDAWYRKHEEIPAEVMRRLLGALSAPPMFYLPCARASHTRSYLAQNTGDPSDKKLIFDGFAVVDRDVTLMMGWPGVTLDPDAYDAARKLFEALNYLGRSESWVSARVVDDRDVRWNCSPLQGGTTNDGYDVVSVAGVVAPESFEARDFSVPATRAKKPRQLTWLEALTWGSAEAIEHTMNRPPVLEPLFYVRSKDALNARPAPVGRHLARVVEITVVRFAVDATVRAPITDALLVGEQIRRNLMGALRRVLGHDGLSSTFSGKDADGRPLRDHSHVSILSLDDDGDGFIDAVLITSPRPLSWEEQSAIDRLHPVPRRNGHPLVLTPVRYGAREQLMTRTVSVVSQTPFAPTQHWRFKRDGDEGAWLTRQLALECQRRGLPPLVEVQRIPPPPSTHRRARWLDFRRARKNDSPQAAYGLRATFAEPVLAPFSLGYGSHFGLGCFVAARSRPGDRSTRAK
jgi:CRISPR-associated protein Csb2